MKLLQLAFPLAEVTFSLVQLILETLVVALQLVEDVTRLDKLRCGLLVGLLQRVARECIQLEEGKE